ncbi:MAG: alanine racemase [Thermomicrobia bacterium]|nr:alanine racemase [Thermomicrobia bacterium]
MERLTPAIADHRRSFVTIDLEAIADNVRAMRSILPPSCAFGAVVKADGYGHGAIPVARAAIAGGASWLLVATVPEGLELRRAGLTDPPILVLGPVAAAEVAALVSARLIPTVDAASPLATLAAVAREQHCAPYDVHVKVDTGLNRFGVAASEAVAFLQSLHVCPEIAVSGVATHFATADVVGDPFLHEQAARFAALLAELTRRGIRPVTAHAANSGAALQGIGCGEMVRVGIALYGIPPAPDFPLPIRLRPALAVQSQIARVFPLAPGDTVGYGRTFVASTHTRAALVPLGYADGLPRSASNRGHLLIGGRRCPLIGNVSMDQCVVAVPDGLAVSVGDPVVIIGRQGNAEQTISTLAEEAGTIAYELAVRFGARMRREVQGGDVRGSGLSTTPDPEA